MSTDLNDQQKHTPQLAHSTRQMFETRLAKYDDPNNLEWDFNDVQDKWARHAYSAFRDLLAAEAENESLRTLVAQLQRQRDEKDEALKMSAWNVENAQEQLHKKVGQLSELRQQLAAAQAEVGNPHIETRPCGCGNDVEYVRADALATARRDAFKEARNAIEESWRSLWGARMQPSEIEVGLVKRFLFVLESAAAKEREK